MVPAPAGYWTGCTVTGALFAGPSGDESGDSVVALAASSSSLGLAESGGASARPSGNGIKHDASEARRMTRCSVITKSLTEIVDFNTDRGVPVAVEAGENRI